MTYTAVTWAYQEVVSSSKLNLMAANEADADARLNAVEDQIDNTTPWTVAALTAPWVSYDGGATFSVPQYKLKLGDTVLNGAMKSGAIGATIFTLPVGMRPLKVQDFMVPANAGVAQLRIAANGVVTVLGYYAGGTNAIVSLSGIRFVAEQ